MTRPFPITAATIALREAVSPDAPDADRMMWAKAQGLMEGYDARWINAGWNTLHVEHEFHLPIINPNTNAKSRSFTQAGKYDGIIEHQNRPGYSYLLEHKTTSEDVSDPNAMYWRRLAIDSQVSAYVLANWQDGTKLEGTLYDVIRKPGIRAKKLSNGERAAFVSDGIYFGKRFGNDVRTAFADTAETETPEMYSARLAHDCKERPDWYFQRRIIPRLDSDVVEYAEELWDVAAEIRTAKQTGRWFRNSGACMTYNTPCPYLGICSGHSSVDDGRWTKRPKQHSELNVVGGDVLTHSSMQTFKTCRRRYFYRHVEGIERLEEEDSESLRFGSLIHIALESWWKCFMAPSQEIQNEHNECPATGVGHGCASSSTELV